MIYGFLLGIFLAAIVYFLRWYFIDRKKPEGYYLIIPDHTYEVGDILTSPITGHKVEVLATCKEGIRVKLLK